ncbi:TetR/AcrR family transcriptional regulator [Pararobbsia silviterrae]|uniref:TetR/AcrR family transcriptional regulator n=1 Tax=Pararobbsia silviterrae TaxID=1792498 RepID=A0A494XMQ7_9BURK|nr:TetR/AcrR family transcriptional regulator [Pararobbsia silviterrae]RKP51967.1 TetR/AcrR family transcriptional regulator [Pararobbsia silviterrae]
MTRKRLTREESRDQTRQRLLDAAEKLIAKKGLAATSVEDIADAAGYTRGAFYSNFGGKNDLFIELLRRDHQQATDQLNALLSDEIPVEQLQSRTREIYSQLYRDNECFMNWTEARMAAARDPKFRAKLSALMQEKRMQIAQFIEYFYQRVGVTPPTTPEAMAMGFMSLVEGVTLFMLSTPQDMNKTQAESILTLFVDSLMELAILKARTPSAL